jgi:hypothetical protein
MQSELRPIPVFESPTADVSRLLTDEDRKALERIATDLDFMPRATIYREQSVARALFIVMDGSVEAVHELPSGRQHITALFFPGDGDVPGCRDTSHPRSCPAATAVLGRAAAHPRDERPGSASAGGRHASLTESPARLPPRTVEHVGTASPR